MSNNIFSVDTEKVEIVKSGFASIDGAIDGFRYGNTYLVSGIEKSGKSSFLMQMVSNLMKSGKKVCYLNTELRDAEFRTAMTAIDNNLPKHEVENDIVLQQKWIDKYKDSLCYVGVSDLSDEKTNTPSFEKLVEKAKEYYKQGIRVFVIDNLSTFASQNSNKPNWEVLSSCGLRIVNFAKNSNSLCFAVVHAKNDVVYSELPSNIRQFVENNEPNKVFDQSLSLVKRLTSNDVHGGSIFRSQLSGTILIWRPFQNWQKSELLPQLTGVILESFRHSASGAMLMMNFNGKVGMFEESISQVAERMFQ